MENNLARNPMHSQVHIDSVNCDGFDYIDVRTFIKEFRSAVGDATSDIPTSAIITYLRLSLNYLSREKGLHRLFEYEDTFELLRMKEDGDYGNSWVLNTSNSANGSSNLGYILDIAKIHILDNSGRPRPTDMRYIPYRWFIKEYPQAQFAKSGTPSAFTLRTTQGRTRIIFNCPISRPYAIDMLYSAAHPRITKESDLIRIPYLFMDLLIDMVSKFYYKEASDFSFARSTQEDIDYTVSQIREMLHQQPSGLEPRRVRRSF